MKRRAAGSGAKIDVKNALWIFPGRVKSPPLFCYTLFVGGIRVKVSQVVRRHMSYRTCLRLSAACLLLCGSATSLHACQACIPYPPNTAADELIEADTVVFAREDPDHPFSYAALETLKGETTTRPIDLFLPSTGRRILAADEDRVAVLVGNADGTWRSLGIADDEYQQVVRRIVLFSAEWNGVEGQERRLRFFLELFGHENSSIHRLAYLELGRAPYGTIKRFSQAVDPEHVRRVLENPRYIEWRPLAILLLANAGDAEDRESIRSSFRSAEQFSLTRNLAALATAVIELEGEAAVQFIDDRYLNNAQRTREELIEVCRALSVHGTDGHTHLRDRIVECYRNLLEARPDMAATVVRDLIAWERFELTAEVSRIADAELTVNDKNDISRYLELAVLSNDTTD
jgi:hypothetical protein